MKPHFILFESENLATSRMRWVNRSYLVNQFELLVQLVPLGTCSEGGTLEKQGLPPAGRPDSLAAYRFSSARQVETSGQRNAGHARPLPGEGSQPIAEREPGFASLIPLWPQFGELAPSSP